jgi:hypothetical protein
MVCTEGKDGRIQRFEEMRCQCQERERDVAEPGVSCGEAGKEGTGENAADMAKGYVPVNLSTGVETLVSF